MPHIEKPENFHTIIQQELRRIEEEERVRILYACESGSRAWGFPSQDSDYDVRFLYIRPVEWYLSIFDKRDVIEKPVSGMLDINGWDLRKALNLFRKSNPPLLEWLQSPIIYEENYRTAGLIRAISPLTFSPKSCMYHYLHMARGNFRDYLQGERVRAKKYFYVIRPLLACCWIEQFNDMPPMSFDVLVEQLVPERSGLRDEIDALLVRKKAGEELDDGPRLPYIHQFIEEKIQHFEQAAAQLPAGQPVQDEQLDELFRETLREAWAVDV
ncbi:nucleotidyltransferase domain-containing protein [Paenibacillus sambharensis]